MHNMRRGHDAAFCVRALEKALGISKPEICNTDQGVQFTSMKFTQHFQDARIRIGMDGCGRV